MKYLTQLAAALAVVTITSTSVVKSPMVTPGDGKLELLILHNNDMHARFEQTSQLSGACTAADREAGKCYGGFPRVAHVVKEARRAAASGEGPPVLYLNAGDTYTGTAWFTIYKWKIAAEFINALQPDAVSLGNHEFDDGVSGLTPFIENLTCPVLAANLNLYNEPTLQKEANLMKSVVFDINGTQVGVIGYLTPETKVLAVRNNVEYIEEIIAIRQEATRLKNTGVKILIALGHSGFNKDLEIAEKVEDIDLVIGGHTNTFLWNGTSPDVENPEDPYPTLVKQASGRQVPVVQAYAYTKYLGKLHLTFDEDGEIVHIDGNPILLDKSIPQDPEVLQIVERYREGVMKISEVVVGSTAVVLNAVTCKRGECSLGNLITDAMVHKYASEYRGQGWTDAPVAIIQRGGIRASIVHIERPANITKGDLLAVMPFDGNLKKVEISGDKILKMLEYAVAKTEYGRFPGQFLHFSGMFVEYDIKNRPGMRVVKASVRCGICDVPMYFPVNRSETYHILMPSFLASGGDGFSMFNDLPMSILNYNELIATTEYVTGHSPIYPEIQGRIIIHNADRINNAPLTKYSLLSISICLLCTKWF